MGILQKVMEHKLLYLETKDVVETTLALDNFKRACDCGRGAVFLSVARGKVALQFSRHSDCIHSFISIQKRLYLRLLKESTLTVITVRCDSLTSLLPYSVCPVCRRSLRDPIRHSIPIHALSRAEGEAELHEGKVQH